jgi:hypothetical protein
MTVQVLIRFAMAIVILVLILVVLLAVFPSFGNAIIDVVQQCQQWGADLRRST